MHWSHGSAVTARANGVAVVTPACDGMNAQMDDQLD